MNPSTFREDDVTIEHAPPELSHETVERARLERTADAARARLLRNVDTLARRTRESLDIKVQLRRNAVPIVVAGSAVLIAVGAIVVGALTRRRYVRAHAIGMRLSALRHAWHHPDAVARARAPSVFARALGSVVLSVAAPIARAMVMRALGYGAHETVRPPRALLPP